MDRLITQALKIATTSTHVANDKNQHEIWFAEILTRLGFNHRKLLDSTKEDTLHLKSVNITKLDVRNGIEISEETKWFVEQPLGSQNTPDFLISDEDGNLFYLELKSSKEEKITWNGGYPKDNFIYLFSTGKYDSQTVFMGSDSWSAANKSSLMFISEIFKQIVNKLNSVIEEGGNDIQILASMVAMVASYMLNGVSFEGDYVEEIPNKTTIGSWKHERLVSELQKHGYDVDPLAKGRLGMWRDVLKEHYHPEDTSRTHVKFYCRNMFDDPTKYYSRDGREQCEQSVYEFVNRCSKQEEVA